ncbi:MAG: hypothetical protein HY811_09260 [Planctomycetes bacterium]|nr:hypothetical protein [Planctomycetota bacterium]
MCQICGCTPCKKCGKPIENGVCSGCGKKSDDCNCKTQTVSGFLEQVRKHLNKWRNFPVP